MWLIGLYPLKFFPIKCVLLYEGANFLSCTKILSHHHPFLPFLPSHFLPCKNTFMDY
jgi:hypothetical protein